MLLLRAYFSQYTSIKIISFDGEKWIQKHESNIPLFVLASGPFQVLKYMSYSRARTLPENKNSIAQKGWIFLVEIVCNDIRVKQRAH